MRRKKKKIKIKKSNKEFLVIMYLFLAVFLSMMIYFVYFQVCKSESFINSPYNSLQDLFSDHVIRGDIVSADGKVLATTKLSAGTHVCPCSWLCGEWKSGTGKPGKFFFVAFP